MLYLRAFGGLALENGGRPIVGAAAQRARLAMLVVLAAAHDRSVSRDRLLALFWPDKDHEHARAALRQGLYTLRRDAEEPDLVLGTAELTLNRAVIGSDVMDFDAALKAGDYDRAVGAYAGALLDGIHLRDAPEFERWVETERERRAHQYRTALEHLAVGAENQGDFRAAAMLFRKLASSDPLSAPAVVSLMKALVKAGDHAAAIQHARSHERLVRAELDVAADGSVVELAREIRMHMTPANGADPSPGSDPSEREPNDAVLEPPSRPSLAPSFQLRAREAMVDERSRHFRNWRALAAGAVALVGVGIVGGSVWRGDRGVPEAESTVVSRSAIVLPDSAPLASVRYAPFGAGRMLAISADGRRLVYVAQRGDTTELYLRQLDRLDATPLIGTEGASRPFFSPDGEWIGFFAGRDLKKVRVTGGPATTLATVSSPRSGVWAHDGQILVVEKGGERLSWVRSTDGEVKRAARQLSVRVLDADLLLGDKWILHASPDGILFLSSLEGGQSYAVTLDGLASPDSVDVSRLVHGSDPRYLECGHIAYFSRDGVLMALPFDLVRRRVLGPPAPMSEERTRLEAIGSAAQLTISRHGTLVYAPGPNERRSVIVGLDPVTGHADTLPFPQAGYRNLTLSPDGRRILVQVDMPSGGPEWRVLDIDRGTEMTVPTGLTPGVSVGYYWWPDGASIVFTEWTSPRAGPPQGVRQSLANPADRVTMSRAGAPSPDGRHFELLMLAASAITHNVVASSQPDSSGRGLWLASTDGSEPDRQLAAGEIAFPVFSPDGAWIAYTDRTAGQSEVYVTRVSNPGERTKITAQAGDQARWTADGKMITYRDGQQWFGVRVSTTNGFAAGPARLLFGGPFQRHDGWSYDVSRDGHRFLLMLGPPDRTMNRLVVVTNWFTDVRRLAPPRAE